MKVFCTIFALACITLARPVLAQENISPSKITAVQKQMTRARAQKTSGVRRRRALKNVVRRAQALIKTAPKAPNRFNLLAIMFQGRKLLLAMDNTERNRNALFQTCEELAKAPDEYAEDRLDADLLLSERKLSAENATLAQRAKALAAIIERYRGTNGEAKSLLMGALIVRKLDARDLENAIHYALDETFSDDPEVIQFRRKHLRISRLDVSFKGAFKRRDGAVLRFPSDIAGHMCLMVFWSKDKPGIEEYLKKTREELAPFGEQVDVFSFNVDELPDGGEAVLRKHRLDWTVMLLPGGRKNQAYRTYAQGDPVAVLVNDYGFAVIRPEVVHGRRSPIDPNRVSDQRYSARLQSLFFGDFLLATLPDSPATGVSNKELRAIRDCFTPVPFRFRLSRKQALENYARAETLCSAAIKKHADAEDLWRVRNYRMIALIGMWNLACEPAHLAAAVAEAEVALAQALPPEADVIPRFCLAKAALRRAEAKIASIPAAFLGKCGGDEAPASALAAAAVLALEAKSRQQHDLYRGQFLKAHGEDPRFFAFSAFLRDRHHRYRLLKANHVRRERGTRGYIINHGREPMTALLPTIELKTLDGGKLVLPNTGNDKLTYLLFIEPPTDPDADFPMHKDRKGKPTTNDPVRRVMTYANNLADQHMYRDIEVIAAFLCDDAARVEKLMQANEWTCTPAMVPGGLKNPMVRRLGIVSADRVPNVFLLRRNGTIAWRASGYRYKAEFGFPFAFLLAMKVHVEVCEVDRAYDALVKGEYKTAAKIFAGPFLPARPDRYAWRGPRHHGKAVAHMGLKEWVNALAAINKALWAHKRRHYRGRGPKRTEDWPKFLADFKLKEPCDVMAELWAAKAVILIELGRTQEAAELRERAGSATEKDYPDVYKQFHEKLKTLRLANE